MEISIYKQWVNDGKKYSDAVEIYKQHGTNATLQQIFSKGETVYSTKKIAFEIKALDNVTSVPVPSYPKTFRQPKLKLNIANYPDALKSEYAKLGPCISEIRFLQSRLGVTVSENKRKELALQILDLGETRRAVFNQIDYWEKHKKLLKPTPDVVITKPEETDNKELQRMKTKHALTLLRSRRSKLKKQTHRVNEYNKVVAEIKKLTLQLENL